jgi:hypothetical protein
MKEIALAMMLVIGGTVAASAQLYGTQSGGLYGTGSSLNSHTVRPYATQQGTYVGGHHATNPNNTQLDNYSTRGNINPYTGQMGTRIPRY